MAARNNADLYQLIFDSWGLRHERTPWAFVANDQPPPYYSHLTILSPGRVREVTAQLRDLSMRFGGAVGFKDSFCELDLRERGFDLLFEACWIWRSGDRPPRASTWERVRHAGDLERWEAAWKAGGSPTDERMFRPSLLQSPAIFFLGRRTAAGDYAAGCIANVSDDCIGISNLFCSAGCDLLPEATQAVATIAPELPIVGYASGRFLSAARHAGYELTGHLRIFGAQQARL